MGRGGGKGGFLTLPLALFIGLSIFVYFFLAPTPSQQFASPLATAPAVALAGQISTLPIITDNSCKGMSTVMSNVMTILQDMAGSWSPGFRTVQVDTANCDVVLGFVPVLGTYNKLVEDSKKTDANNATSVKTLYEDAFMLSSDVIIINDGISYKVAFKSTGELNDALGLAKLQSLCSDCYPVVLSGIHWAIRDYMNQFLCQFENFAAKYVPMVPNPAC